MTKVTNTFFNNLFATSMRLALLGSVAAAVTVAVRADDTKDIHAGHRTIKAAAKLVEVVRTATRQYIDVNAARIANYQPAFGCITGPEAGAMGVHYINGGLVADGEVDATRPEALIYEPSALGLQLVGVEFIVDAAAWNARHTAPPMLEGQAFQFVSSPNRYGIPAFYELHVWAWRDNPNGAFVDWNTQVSCEGQ